MEVEEIFQKSGAILKGHFLLASGLHSPIYWEKFQVLQYPNYTGQLCYKISTHFRKQGIIKNLAAPIADFRQDEKNHAKQDVTFLDKIQ